MTDSKAPIKVEISHKTVIFTAAFLISLWLIIQLKEIIVFLFLSAILLSALLKPVEWLSSKRIPRPLALLAIYITVIGLLSAAISVIVPPLISQTSDFISKIPQIVSSVNDFLVFYKIPTENFSQILAKQAQDFAGNLIDISKAIFQSVILLITLFVFTFYLILQWKYIVRLISSPFSGKQEKKVTNIISKVEKGLGNWIRGQLALSIVIGILTYIGLIILNFPFALPLALIAAIFEIIPIVGPIISAVPGILVGFSISPVLGLAAVAMYIVIHQLENHLVVPMIMSKVVGLQPPAVILALLVGAKLAGIGGAFFAIPIIVVVKILVKELLIEDQKLEDETAEEQKLL